MAVELQEGGVYRGQLRRAEESMGLHLSDVTHIAADGQRHSMEHVYVKGSQIKFVVVPDSLSAAPGLQKVAALAAGTSASGRAKK